MKKLMSLREGLCVMMRCYTQQYSGQRYWLHEHPRGHASWRESTMTKFTKESTTYFVKGPVCRWNIQKTQSEPSEYVRKTTGFFANGWRNKIALESYFEEHAKEVWERVWLNPEMQATLLNTHPPKLVATILKALREYLKENDQLNAVEEIAGPIQTIPLENDQILKEAGRFWDDVNGGYLPEDLVLAATREEIDSVYSEDCLRDCSNASMKPLDLNLGGHRQICGPNAQEYSIETVCQGIQDEDARQDSKSFLLASQLFSAMPPLEAVKVLCLNHDVGELVEQLESIEVETLRHQPSTVPRNSPETHFHPSSSRRSSEIW